MASANRTASRKRSRITRAQGQRPYDAQLTALAPTELLKCRHWRVGSPAAGRGAVHLVHWHPSARRNVDESIYECSTHHASAYCSDEPKPTTATLGATAYFAYARSGCLARIALVDEADPSSMMKPASARMRRRIDAESLARASVRMPDEAQRLSNDHGIKTAERFTA